jgi:hypothetical protein
MSRPPGFIQMEELYARRQQSDTARLRAYDSILKQIMNRIKVHSQLPTLPTEILYEVPFFIVGIPRLDMKDVVSYIAYQLRAAGFEVRFTFPNLLNISWKHYERQYILQHSPIFKSMVQSASHIMNAPEPKKPTLLKSSLASGEKKKVRFDKPKQPQMAALEYQPPVEFFKAIDTPKPPSTFTDISKF